MGSDKQPTETIVETLDRMIEEQRQTIARIEWAKGVVLALQERNKQRRQE